MRSAILALLCWLLAGPSVNGASGIGMGAGPAAHYAELPLAFEENDGQTDAAVRFFARGAGYIVFLTPGEAVLSLRPAVVLRMSALGANRAASIEPANLLAGKSNSFIGNDAEKWRTDVPLYRQVRYRDLYPGIDLLYYGNQQQLEYDFIVSPSADPSAIRLAIESSSKASVAVGDRGDLVIHLDGGDVRFLKPVAYQEAAHASSQPADPERRTSVQARWVVKSNDRIGFELGSFDRTRPLIIDPVLVYSTYLAGSFMEESHAVAVDASGSAYVTGLTNSTTFPTTNGALDTSCGTDGACNGGGSSNTDVFVTKLNPAGTGLVYSTFLGGALRDTGYGIAVSSGGNAYVTGDVQSTDFPVTAGAYQTSCGPQVARNNFTCAIVSTTTCGPGGVPDAFVAKLNATGSALVYSTFLGGSLNDYGRGIAVNAAQEAYVVGVTLSQQSVDMSLCNPGNVANAYPTTSGGFMAAPAPSGTGWPGFYGTSYVFFSKLAASGSNLIYSTYLGSAGVYGAGNSGSAVAIDSSGNGYITGVTNVPTFQTTSGVVQPSLAGTNQDAFVAKLNPSLPGAASLVYSTFFGGSGHDYGTGIAVDSSGSAYVTGLAGYNGAPSPDFPVTPGAFQPACSAPMVSCGDRSFVAKLNPSASALAYSTFLHGGDNGAVHSYAISLDAAGRAYVAGATNSASFPTIDPIQPGLLGGLNAFVTTLNPAGSGVDFSTYLGSSGTDNAYGIALDPAGRIYVTGSTVSSSNFPTTAGAFQTACAKCATVAAGAFVAKISAVPAATPAATVSPMSLGFGNQPPNTTSASQPVTLTSTGTLALTVSSITASAGFLQNNDCPIAPNTLAIGAHCTISVRFAPTAAGTVVGALTITDDAAGSPQSVVLAGTGVSVCTYTLATAGTTVGAAASSASVRLTTQPGCAWSATATVSWLAISSASSGTGSATVQFSVAANPSSATRVGTLTIAGQMFTVTQLGGLPTMALDKTALQFGAVSNGVSFLSETSSQPVQLTQSGIGTVRWTATSNQPWLTVSPTSGSGSATLSIGVSWSGGLPIGGSVNGSISLTFAGAENSPGPISVVLVTFAAGKSANPFGVIDTPADNTTGVTGAIPVTGWAIDDVEVSGVTICRAAVAPEVAPVDANCGGLAQIFLGNGVFIDGARPDVQAAYPNTPRSSAAGWGFMVLTNMLPNQGNGVFTMYAYARDRDGHVVLLGTRTMTCANAQATAPFGTIDTPGQGETVSGSQYVNFGWALTQNPKIIPIDGSTLQVYVDGVAVGNPSYGHYRSDIATFFPGLANSGGAVGFRIIDTTLLSSGLHTIVWTATDSARMTSGLGSRFFRVSNGVASNVTAVMTTAADSMASIAPLSRQALAAVPLDTSPIVGRRGWDSDTPWRAYVVGRAGRAVLRGEEIDRFELQLGEHAGETYTGYVRAGEALNALPIGSRLGAETGEFTWSPGVGFVGVYDLVFVRRAGARIVARQEVRIILHPKGSGHVGAQVVIDAPGSQHDVGQPFPLSGWAADLDAAAGTGIDTLHVWAYPLAGELPVFLGTATSGRPRADVAARYGDQFRNSGYDLTFQGLAPGDYDLAVFAWRNATGGFVPAKLVRVTIR